MRQRPFDVTCRDVLATNGRMHEEMKGFPSYVDVPSRRDPE